MANLSEFISIMTKSIVLKQVEFIEDDSHCLSTGSPPDPPLWQAPEPLLRNLKCSFPHQLMFRHISSFRQHHQQSSWLLAVFQTAFKLFQSPCGASALASCTSRPVDLSTCFIIRGSSATVVSNLNDIKEILGNSGYGRISALQLALAESWLL
jgi:hypothetical protein